MNRFKVCALAGLTALLPGCLLPAKTWRGQVEWPGDYTGRGVVPFSDAGTALAAAAAIRELIATNPYPHLFQGCSSPEQGLAFAVHEGPTPGLYYVMLEERFDRCGGPRHRVLDWWHVYAVTPQGEVVAAAPQPQWAWEAVENSAPAALEAPGPGSTVKDPVPPGQPEPPSPPPSDPSPSTPINEPDTTSPPP